MYILRLLLSSLLVYSTNCNQLLGEKLTDDVTVFKGIAYAQPPLRELRFQKPSEIKLDLSKTYNQEKSPCLEWPFADGDEDCLYLDLYRYGNPENKKDTLLLITNDRVSHEKAAKIAREDLNFAVAHIRTGVFGHLDGADYGTSDVITLVRFIRAYSDALKIGKLSLWAEGAAAETVNAALALFQDNEISRAILVNGNQLTRTFERKKYSQLAAYKFRKQLLCDLPSSSQSNDCLRTKSTKEIVEASAAVHSSFYPLGDPFRVQINEKLPEKQIPTILGLYRQPPIGYSVDANFTAEFTYETFKRFLTSAVPDSLHRNGPLLRRVLLHEYIHSKGSKKNTYFLFQQINKILLDRDFFVPTYQLTQHLADNKNTAYLFEYGIDNPPKSCIQDGGWDDIDGFCNKMLQYFTRFATKGEPTEKGCNPNNPSWPAWHSSKRDYYIVLKYDGKIDWEFDFHLAAVELWLNLLPSLDQVELAGRRDAVFAEEEPLDAILVEDDVQDWHNQGAEKSEDYLKDQEKAEKEMRFHEEI